MAVAGPLLLFVCTNLPLAIVYVWRRFNHQPGKPYREFVGPIVCMILLHLADAPWLDGRVGRHLRSRLPRVYR
jgi:hypothetical protein